MEGPGAVTTDDDIDLPEARGDDLTDQKGVRDYLLEVFAGVELGFANQQQRVNDILDYWDIYNCTLNSRQYYTGTSQIFVPIVHNAVNARVTRFINQIFPPSGRNVEVTSSDETLPDAITSLIENYISKSKLRTEVIPALIRNGDVEGQYNCYVDWTEIVRHVTTRVKKPLDLGESGLEDVSEEVDDIEEVRVPDEHPVVEVLSDADVVVLPQTSDSVEKALAAGGSATIIRRWGKAKIRQLIKDGLIRKDAGERMLEALSKNSEPAAHRDVRQENIDTAGIKEGEDAYALIYETWLELRIGGENRRCRAFYGGEENILGCHLNPFWSDRLPLLSCPVDKVAGVFKGISKVKPCATLQYAANDAINEGMDSAAYALLPIVMTDPEKNPRVGSMVLATAAIWETSPQDTQFAEFPQLWREAFQIVAACKAQVAETLGVSPAAITQQASEKRLSQAEIASEQQVDILSTADAVTTLEAGILTPTVVLFAELDHQHRDQNILVRSYGQLGISAVMEDIAPLQMEKRYQFKWFGVEAARNAQQVQLQISGMNIFAGIPPQLYPGHKLNLVPLLVQLAENMFGPRLAPLIFEDMRAQLSIPPEQENELLAEGIDCLVHPMDDDAKHLQVHMMLMQNGDPSGMVRVHMQRHQQSLQLKATQQMAQQAQLAALGGAGQGGQPGQSGPPGLRPGAQPGTPRGGTQKPPGAIHQDEMIDPHRTPR